jgi:hypothetical protein
MTRLKAVAIAIDQLVNAVFGGWPDETISSRAYRWHLDGKRTWPKRLIDTLFFFERDHCCASFNSEEIGAHLPRSLRRKAT